MPTVHTYVIDVVEDETGGTATFAHEDERTREGIFARGVDGGEAMTNLLARLRVIDLDDISLVSPSAPDPEAEVELAGGGRLEPSEVAVPAADIIEEFRLAAGTDTEFWFSYRAHDGETTQRRVRVLSPGVVERGFAHELGRGGRWRLNAFDLDKDAPRNFTIAGVTDVVKVG